MANEHKKESARVEEEVSFEAKQAAKASTLGSNVQHGEEVEEGASAKIEIASKCTAANGTATLETMNDLALASSKITASLAHSGATPEVIRDINGLRDAVEQELEVMDEGALWSSHVTKKHTYEYREVPGEFRVRPRSFVGPIQIVKSLDELE